jgi:FkbM family methyltransferase
LIEKILKPGDIFFDVGANLGYFSAVAANAVGNNGEIYCFDIDPRCINNLNEFKNMNPNYKIYPNNIALGAKNEHINIELTENHTWNTILQSNKINRTGRIHNLKMITLSSFIISNKLRMPKLIKIDVEGAEHGVLSGLSDILKQNKNHPFIIMEIANYENNVSLICELINELDYKIISTIPPFHVIKSVDITSMTNVLLEPVVK